MYVYRKGRPDAPGRHWLMVQPARQSHDKSSDFFDEKGEPILFNIEFVHGRASVADNLGRWLVDHGYAQDTALILPASV
ncbi:MAG: hypothetical protein ACXU85_01785 [Xanthobacteraceae bacterium]